MNQKFLEVLKHEGPVTIIAKNSHPLAVVSTWMSYIKVVDNKKLLYIPAAGMHSLENSFQNNNNEVLLTFGSKEVRGTEGPGAGFYVTGEGSFLSSGEIFTEFKKKFPWIRKVLQVEVTNIEQKI